MTTKILKDAARQIDGEDKATVRDIRRSTGCTSIENGRMTRGRKTRRVKIRAPSMDVTMHAMRLLEEQVKEHMVEVDRVQRSQREAFAVVSSTDGHTRKMAEPRRM